MVGVVAGTNLAGPHNLDMSILQVSVTVKFAFASSGHAFTPRSKSNVEEDVGIAAKLQN